MSQLGYLLKYFFGYLIYETVKIKVSYQEQKMIAGRSWVFDGSRSGWKLEQRNALKLLLSELLEQLEILFVPCGHQESIDATMYLKSER